MKHMIRDSIIFCIDALGISFLYRLYFRRKGPLVRVICFHDVEDKEWFERVVSMLVSKFHVITPDQFHARQFDDEKINVLLTFDDGYQSWIDNCLPVLQKYKIRSLFFINSGLLDVAEDSEKVADFMVQKLLISPKRALTWRGARQLVVEGHTIGGHTVSHPNLASLSEDEVRMEVEQDKSEIEQLSGITLVDFAYPFGAKKHIRKNLIPIVSKNYPYQYSAITGFFNEKQDLLIPRTLIEKKQSTQSIQRWIKGGYDIFKYLEV